MTGVHMIRGTIWGFPKMRGLFTGVIWGYMRLDVFKDYCLGFGVSQN